MKRALITALCAIAPICAQEGTRFEFEGKMTVDIDLASIRRTPEAFKNVYVRFDVQFCSMGRIQNPFFTSFVPTDFANFYAWAGDQPIWRKESYDDVFGMLFMHKENPRIENLYDLRLYDRVQVTGVVRNVFQGAPWIEAIAFEKNESKIDTPTLAHLYRAESHMQRREWSRAISELSMAPAGGKPSYVLNAVNRNLGVCYLRVGEAEKAQTYLSMATQGDAGRDRETARLARVATDNPRLEIDHDVDSSRIGDADRPMWEAFDEGRSTGAPARPQR